MPSCHLSESTDVAPIILMRSLVCNRITIMFRPRVREALFLFLAAVTSSLLIANTSDSYQLTVYCLSYLAIAYTLVKIISIRQPVDPFSPAPVFLSLFFLYSYASAKYSLDNGTTLFGDVISADTLSLFYVSCLLSLAGLCIGFIYSAFKPPCTWSPATILKNLKDKAFFKHSLLWIPILCLPFIVFLRKAFDFTSVESYADTAFLSRVLYMEKGSDQGIFEYVTYVAPLYLILALGILLVFRANVYLRALGLLLVGAHIATMFLSGSRSSLAAVFCLVLVFIHYRVRRLSAASVAFILVLGLIMVNLISVLRVTSDPAVMVDTVSTLVSSDDQKVTSVSNSGELLTGQNLMRLIDGIHRGETGYTYGESIFTETLIFLPRSFLANRPLTLAEKFVDTFYPGVLESGGGYGFFFVMEGYWAFGLVGTFLFGLFYAYLLDRFYRWCMRYIGSDAIAILYGIALFPLAMFSIRSGLIISIKTMLMDVAPILFLMALPRLGDRFFTARRRIG